jgi:hypothetical protein
MTSSWSGSDADGMGDSWTAEPELRPFESASRGALALRLQLVVEIGTPVDGRARRDTELGDADADRTGLAAVLETARTLLLELSKGGDVRTATLAWPSGLRLVAERVATPEDLEALRAAGVTLAQPSKF